MFPMATKVNIEKMTQRHCLISNILPGKCLFKFIQLFVRYCDGVFLGSKVKLFMDIGIFGFILQSRHSNWVKYYFNL